MGGDDESVASSTVEFDGMDMNDEEDNVGEEDDVAEEKAMEDEQDANDEDDGIAKQDDLDMEETRKERMELMAAETQSAVLSDDAQGRFEYLMQQSEVFAHFLAGKYGSNSTTMHSYYFVLTTFSFSKKRLCGGNRCEKGQKGISRKV